MLLGLNKIDLLIGEDRRAALDSIETAAGELLGCEPEAVFAVSAREGEGMAALRRRLRRLATEKRMGTLALSFAQLVAAAAAEIIGAARLETHASELPLRDLQLELLAEEQATD